MAYSTGGRLRQQLLQVLAVVAVAWLGSVGSVNPGLQFRLSRSGLNYAATVAVDVLTTKVKTLAIPDQHGSADVKVGKVSYDVTGMRVTGFRKPATNVAINAGSGLMWSLSNAGVSMNGNWHYKYQLGFIKIQDHGSFDGDVSGASIAVSVSIGDDPKGRLTIRSTGCQCNVDAVKIKLHGGASWLYNLFVKNVEAPIRKGLGEQLCAQARRVIDRNAQAELDNLPYDITLDDRWVFDYRLVAAPEFRSEFLDSFHKGEFFARNDRTHEAPYQAAAFPLSATNRMVTIWASDYILNTVGYVLYKNAVLKKHLTKKDLPAKDRGVLNTTCTGLECFGLLVPQAAAAYPGASVELEMAASSPPSASISAAGIKGNFGGTVNFSARLGNGSLAPMFQTRVTVVASVAVTIAGGNVVRGNVTGLSPKITVTASQIGAISDFVLNAAFDLVSNVLLVPQLNEAGQRGIPIPGVKDVVFENTKLEMESDCLRIATDVRYSPALRFEAKTQKRRP